MAAEEPMVIQRHVIAALAVLCLSPAVPVAAHPVPFTFVDVRLQPGAIDLTLVAHIFDVAHDLGIQPQEQLLQPGPLVARGNDIIALLRDRLRFTADRQPLGPGQWSAPEPIPERQSIRLRARFALPPSPGRVELATVMFPYDPQHRTFLNFYESDALTQAIVDKDRSRFEYFTGTRQGVLEVLRRFIPSGVHHILIGPDHLLFLVGLLLLGGSIKQLLLVVTAFTAAHSTTLSLAALGMLIPPASAIEPAIALSVVYVGADNLLVRDGRDTRAWIAFAFGLIHGFGFANVLREMDLPARALGWTLFGFNLGVEIGQLGVVAIVASALAWVRLRNPVVGTRLAFVGSIIVILAGTFWFVERVFYSGGAV
jgi:hydrogenase/urease accessory protein HupE